MATCKDCGAEIHWRSHQRTGRSAPINVEPDPTGNIVLLPGEKYRIAIERDPDSILHTNHFATCPFAKKFRVNR